jgi:hypothetical protein
MVFCIKNLQTYFQSTYLLYITTYTMAAEVATATQPTTTKPDSDPLPGLNNSRGS